jgi:hypothetical protein
MSGAVTVGRLIVDMAADVAQLKADMSTAAGVVEAAGTQIQRVADAAKAALIGLAAAMGPAMFVEMISGSIEATAALEKMSEKTGASVEALSAIRSAAKLVGVDMDAVAQGIGKLDVAMVSAAAGSGKAADAFTSLGVSVLDSSGKMRSTDDVMLDVAVAFSKLEGGALKTADAVAIFGKAGKELIPVLNELGTAGEFAATVTTQQAVVAKDLEENWTRLGAAGRAMKTIIANEMAPVLDALVLTFLNAQREGGGLLGTVKDLAADGTLKQWAFDVGVQLMKLADALIDTKNFVVFLGEGLAGLALVAKGTWDVLAGGLAIMAGDVQGGLQLVTQGVTNAKSAWTGLRDAWSDLSFSTKMQDAFVENMIAVNGLTKAHKDNADGVDHLKAVYADYASTINGLQLQLDKLTGTDGGYSHLHKAELQVAADLAAGKILNDDQISQLYTLAFALDAATLKKVADTAAMKEWTAQQSTMTKALDTWQKLQDTANATFKTWSAGLADGVQKSNDEVLALGMSAGALRDMNAVREIDKKTQIEVAALRKAGLDDLADEAQAQGETAKQTVIANNLKIDSINAWRSVLDAATTGVSNFIVDFATHGTKAFKDLWQNFKTWALQALAEIAAKQIIVAIVGQFTTAGGAAATAASGLSGSGGGAGSLLSTAASSATSLFSGSQTAGSLLASGTSGAGGLTGLFGASSTTAALAGDAFMPGLLAGTDGLAAGAGAAAGGVFAEGAGALAAEGGAAALEAGLSAIPVYGWIAAAAIAAYFAFAKKGGGPKVGGVAGSTSGLNQYGGELTSEGNANANALLAEIQKTYAADFTSLGGTGTGSANFGISFDTDPQGTAQSRLSGGVDVNGRSVYSLTDMDSGRDAGSLASGASLVSSREVLAGLQGSNLPPAVLAILARLDANTATNAQIADALNAAAAANTAAAKNNQASSGIWQSTISNPYTGWQTAPGP